MKSAALMAAILQMLTLTVDIDVYLLLRGAFFILCFPSAGGGVDLFFAYVAKGYGPTLGIGLGCSA